MADHDLVLETIADAISVHRIREVDATDEPLCSCGHNSDPYLGHVAGEVLAALQEQDLVDVTPEP